MFVQINKAAARGPKARDIGSISLEVSRDELRTIWFGLEQYKTALKKDAEKASNKEGKWGIEDEAFLYDEIAKVCLLQFNMLLNHDAEVRDAIIEWSELGDFVYPPNNNYTNSPNDNL